MSSQLLTLDPAAIRWVAFDAVGTLIRPQPPVADVYHRAGRRHGSRLTRDEVARRFREALVQADQPDATGCRCATGSDPLHTCEARESRRWRTIVERVLDDVEQIDPCFAELFAHFGQPSAWGCYPDAGPALASLRAKGLRLAVCSNFDARLHPVLDGLPELAPIELRVISSLVGYRKPSRRFFEALLERSGCQPHELLVVGDDRRNDVDAARAAAIQALQIDRLPPSRDNRILQSLDELVGRLGPGRA
jgi:putative hydrolase of the HAD superfamily